MSGELTNTFGQLSWEYIAGFFDGEGCIHIREQVPGRLRRRVHLKLTQGEVNEAASDVMRDIHEFLREKGVGARLQAYRARRVDWRGGVSIASTSSLGSETWLNGMLPFLRVKRAQALEALEVLKGMAFRWLSDDEKERILTLRTEGRSITQIGTTLGRSKVTIKRALTMAGVYAPFKRGR